jgi:N-acetyl-gamma-glutamyl-phosphate reductase
MIKVGIYGASGYTGQELLRLLLRHPEVEIVALTSRQFKGMPISHVYPVFEGLTDLRYMDASADDVADLSDFVFLAVPHGEAMEVAPVLLEAGKKVVDLSADFRLRDASVYEKWYGKHEAPEFLGEAVYGLPELYRETIKGARLVANPGCYPTSVILGLAPLLQKGMIDKASIIVDAKSGVSGAGRETKIGSLFCEVNEGFKAYNVFAHRHHPEMEQEISLLAGSRVNISFAPHLLPLDRGILSSIYASLHDDRSAADLLELYRDFYEGEKFVRVYRENAYPNLSSVRGSNFCDIGLTVDGRMKRVAVFSVIDNLIKGAAGQALQNMNLMCGFREDTGLDLVPLFP